MGIGNCVCDLLMTRILFMCNGGGNEDEGQHCEDESLDETHESFQEEKRKRNEVRSEESDDREQDFAGKDVAEEPERKRDQFSNFGD